MLPTPTDPILAQQQTTTGVDVVSVILWCVVLLGILVAGMFLALRLKRRMKAEDDVPVPASGFTLSDLRQMHRTGQLSDAEFAKAKEKVVAAAQKAAERVVDPAVPVQKDSVDAIRARRLAREAQEPPGSDADEAGPDR